MSETTGVTLRNDVRKIRTDLANVRSEVITLRAMMGAVIFVAFVGAREFHLMGILMASAIAFVPIRVACYLFDRRKQALKSVQASATH